MVLMMEIERTSSWRCIVMKLYHWVSYVAVKNDDDDDDDDQHVHKGVDRIDVGLVGKSFTS